MKYKLNMLEPGTKILKAAVLLILVCGLSYLLKIKILMVITGVLFLICILIVFIGVVIELKQDDILFERHKNLENHPNKVDGLYECQNCGARFKCRQSSCPNCNKTLNYTDGE
jgi:protein-S-isoprenylcysteine O-methyltransferase Ste14